MTIDPKAPVKMNELGKLAKLLATENITIEHSNVQTAMFDVKNRVLVLPTWKNMNRELYHMMVLHEVGHALYTTPEAWEGAIKKYPGIQNWINVIEDARIERLIKQKYPGSRPDFRNGYKDLYDRDFFKVDGKNLEDLQFGDRVNLHYKIGELVDVPIHKYEQMFIDAIDKALTFKDVEDIAIELYQYQKSKKVSDEFKKKHGNNQQGQGSGQGQSDDDDGDGNSGGQSGKEGGQEGAVGGEADSTGSLAGTKGGGSAIAKEKDDFKTVTSFENSVGNEFVDKQAVTMSYIDTLNDLDPEKWVIPYKTTVEILRKNYSQILGGNYFVEMRQRNIKTVNYLVKEFLMRKSADGFSRQREDKTGVIDPNKLHAYTMIDDIFSRNTVIPDSKNHGLIMVVDFSGSMGGYMKPTIEQLVNLILFCRKLNIPHRVFGFSDATNSWFNTVDKSQVRIKGNPLQFDSRKIGEISRDRQQYVMKLARESNRKVALVPEPGFNLIELANDNMSHDDFKTMMEGMICAFSGGITDWNDYPGVFQLGGTPFESSIVASKYMIKRFKKDTGAQIVSMIYLTDGEGAGASAVRNSNITHVSGHAQNTVLRDPKTGKVFTPNEKEVFSDVLIRWVKNDGCNTIGYRVGNDRHLNNEFDFRLSPERAKKYKDLLKKDRCVSIPDNRGYDLSNYLLFKENDNISKGNISAGTFSFDVKAGSSKGQIQRAFSGARKDRMDIRAILRNFIKEIA